MKIGVAIYFKNIERYPVSWTKKCFESIANQTYRNFDIYILNYGKSPDFEFKYQVPVSFITEHNCQYLEQPLGNYADAMNYIYAKIFETCDVAVNTNIDDYYSVDRIECLIKDLEAGADIASSNMHIVNEEGKVTYSLRNHRMDIYTQLQQGYNPVSNPGHAMKKRVFDKLKFDSSIVPVEDMDYWKKAIEGGFRIIINKRYLHYYRMHPGQETHQYK